MEKNKMIISSDPYKKCNHYIWHREDGMWEDLSENENSKFNSDYFTKSSIYYIADDLFKTIVEKLYSPTMGLIIFFGGTDADFEYLSEVGKKYCSENDIELVRYHKKMKSAKDVVDEIEGSFKKLKEYFEDSGNEEAKVAANKYKKAVKPEIAICVAGKFSSGKSAFINSLIGQEILPSADNPTTAKIYQIRKSEKCEITFILDEMEYIVEYGDTEWDCKPNPASDIAQQIKKCFEEKQTETTEQRMYWTLNVLNGLANEKNEKGSNRLDDLIEIKVNFIHSYLSNDFDFVVYDTPGNDVATCENHIKTLKKALEEQTSGLPIVVTTPTDIESTGNKDILDDIQKLGGALDNSNLMIVVNKCDGQSNSQLKVRREQIEEFLRTKKRGGGCYFVSSIIALGGKKTIPRSWINDGYEDVFYCHHQKFSTPDDEKHYLRLSEYNICSEEAKERVDKRTAEILLVSSGIPCVEEEINIFAKRFALYNKVSQAIKYLTDAAYRVEKDIKGEQQVAKELCKEIEEKLDTGTKKLKEQLENEYDRKKAQFTSEYADNVINSCVYHFLEDKRIEERVNWAIEMSGEKKGSEKVDDFNRRIERAISVDMKAYALMATSKARGYWHQCDTDIRNSLIEIIKGNSILTEEQREKVKKVILAVPEVADEHKIFNIKNTSAIKRRLFFIHISKKESIKCYREALSIDIQESNTCTIKNNENALESWSKHLLNVLEAQLTSFNPELKEYSEELKMQDEKIKKMEKQLNSIKTEINTIEQLCEFEETNNE